MRRVALKGLWLRRGRAMLTAFAVVLGVAMVCGTFVLTDTINRAFDEIFATGASKTSAVIKGRAVVQESSSGAATLPQSLVERVRDVPQVAAAAGTIEAEGVGPDQVRLVGPDGKTIGSANAPKLGFGFDPDQDRFNPFTITAGRFATGPGEVAVDKGTADEEKLEVGDRIEVAAQGGARRFTVVGIARFGEVNSLGGATMGLFDLATAQKLLDKEGQLDAISVAAAPGTTPKQLVEVLEPVVPAGAVVRTAEQDAAENAKDIEEATAFIQYFLLAFGFIALGVGAFVIYNTLSITVAQRIRELATLRSLGASREQVRRSVMLEGLAVGVLASLTGLALGYFLAQGLSAIFVAFGIDLPKTDPVLATRTIIVSLAVGIVVTVIASISPARRATRISPVAAMQEGATLPARLGSRRPIVPGMVLALAAGLLATGALGDLSVAGSLIVLAAGCLTLFVAAAMLSNRVVHPLARFVGAPARRLGGSAGRLACANATRNPHRTATTAAALMIGLALVTLVATLGQGLRESDRRSLEDGVHADYVVTAANGWETIPSAAGEAASRVPGLRAFPVRHDRAQAFGEGVSVDGLPPGSQDVLDLDVSGDPALPAGGQAIVERGWASDHDLAVGSALPLTTPNGRRLTLTVSALHDRTPIQKIDPLLGRVLISQATFDAAFPRPADQYVFVTGDAPVFELKAAVAGFPDITAQSRADWITDRVDGINRLLNLLYVLLALSVIVSLFGMINTLVLSVFERTREIGMLRAVGMSRRQVRRMVRHESVITALIGAALGLPLGLLLAGLMSKALEDEGVAFAVPFGSLIAFTIVAVIAGMLAAIAPARRAARLDVLRALQYE